MIDTVKEGSTMTYCIEILKEQIELNPDRYKSVLRIPKISNQNLTSDIKTILMHVDMKKFKHLDFVKFMCSTYGIAQNTAVNICPTLERANILMKNIDGIIKLTNIGRKYLQDNRSEYIGKGFIENHFGFLEMLLLLLQKNAKNRNSIFSDWVRMYEIEHGTRSYTTHKSQFNNVFKYLLELNYISKECNVNEEKIIRTFEIDVY